MKKQSVSRLEPWHFPEAAEERGGLTGGGEEVNSLLERLVDATSLGKTAAPAEPGVLLDREVDGVRCLLIRREPAPPAGPAVPEVLLSPREREIARMVAKGYPNKTIAGVLSISAWTVSTHLRRIFAKLSVTSRAAMVARLIEERLIGEASRGA